MNCLVSLLEAWEEAELFLTQERSIAGELGIEFLSYPIRDRTVPTDIESYAEFVAQLARRVKDGRSVAVHCRGGIGRSGITVASVLVALGGDPDRVFDQISEARGWPVPDTEDQATWFELNHAVFKAIDFT